MLNRTSALGLIVIATLGTLGFACSSSSGTGGGGSAGSGGGPGGGAGGGGTPARPLAKCENPKPLARGGKDTGYVTCDDGSINRVKAVGCEGAPPGCQNDSDCGSDEVCLCDGLPGASDRPACVKAGCRVGSDCESGECGLNIEQDCADPAQISCRDLQHDGCRSDSDCDPDFAELCYTPNGSDRRVCMYDGCTG